MRITRRGAIAGASALAATTSAFATTPPPLEPVKLHASLAVLQRFVGNWEGAGDGEPGLSTVIRSYEPVLGGHFLMVRNASFYAPQHKNPKGEEHEDVGYFSFDKARKRFVLRQFHVEGFANQFVSKGDGFDGNEFIVESEALANIGKGWRARETYRFDGANAFEEIFELAEPGKEFAVYSRNYLRRA